MTGVVGRSRQAMKEFQAGVLAEYVPYTPLTGQNLKKLADLKPKIGRASCRERVLVAV